MRESRVGFHIVVTARFSPWKICFEPCARARRALDVDRSMMLGDDPVHCRQAETGPAAGLLRGEEGLEDAPHGRTVHAAAGVRHGQTNVAPRWKATVGQQT